MLKLHIPDMSCGHCVATIETAVKGIDPQARIEADIQARTVAVETQATVEQIQDAVRGAGYENSPAVRAG